MAISFAGYGCLTWQPLSPICQSSPVTDSQVDGGQLGAILRSFCSIVCFLNNLFGVILPFVWLSNTIPAYVTSQKLQGNELIVFSYNQCYSSYIFHLISTKLYVTKTLGSTSYYFSWQSAKF